MALAPLGPFTNAYPVSTSKNSPPTPGLTTSVPITAEAVEAVVRKPFQFLAEVSLPFSSLSSDVYDGAVSPASSSAPSDSLSVPSTPTPVSGTPTGRSTPTFRLATISPREEKRDPPRSQSALGHHSSQPKPSSRSKSALGNYPEHPHTIGEPSVSSGVVSTAGDSITVSVKLGGSPQIHLKSPLLAKRKGLAKGGETAKATSTTAPAACPITSSSAPTMADMVRNLGLPPATS